MNELYLPCDCSCEVIRLEYDTENNEYFLSIYEFKKKYSFWHKLKYMWQILRTGEPYSDQISLSKEKMVELKDWIEKSLGYCNYE